MEIYIDLYWKYIGINMGNFFWELNIGNMFENSSFFEFLGLNMGHFFENSSFFQVSLLVRRSTRIRGRKKRHGNLKSALLAVSGQNGHIFQVFLIVRRSTQIRGRKKRHVNLKSAFLVKNVHRWLKMSYFDEKWLKIDNFIGYWSQKVPKTDNFMRPAPKAITSWRPVIR